MKFRKRLVVILLLGFIVLLFAGLWWLGLLIAAFVGIYTLRYSDWKVLYFIKQNSFVSYPLVFLVAIFFVVSVRVFVFRIFAVPSSSMADAIFPGDILIVDQLAYGPKMPRSLSDIPWVRLFSNPGDSCQWDYHRLSGYGRYQSGDIMVFSHPEREESYIKRCIALPGDTLRISDGRVYINSHPLEENPTVKQWYNVRYRNEIELHNALDSLKIGRHQLIPNQNNTSDIFLTNVKATALSDQAGIGSIKINTIPIDTIPQAFPRKEILWSKDFFGPMVIPEKGMSIALTEHNFALYGGMISGQEGSKLTMQDGRFYMAGNEVKKYTFQKDYFFMMGDNRYYSRDSRYWGPVSEEKIIGRPLFVLFSQDKSGFKWDRVFKLLE